MSQELSTTRNSIQPHNEGPSSRWSSAGDAYDEVSRGIIDAIEHATNRLEPEPGDQILDVATGTGWGARRLADRGYSVIGVDFAPDLLDAARDKATARNLDIRFELGDAEALPFDDASFDKVISTFGVMFAQRPENAARELARVCKPGGRIVLTTWKPESSVFEMFRIIKTYMPAPAQEPPSPFEWGKPERVRELLGDAFDLAMEPATSYYRVPDGRAAWKTFVNGFGPIRSLVAEMDAEQRAALEHDFVALHDRYCSDLGITVPRDYMIIRGDRH